MYYLETIDQLHQWGTVQPEQVRQLTSRSLRGDLSLLEKYPKLEQLHCPVVIQEDQLFLLLTRLLNSSQLRWITLLFCLEQSIFFSLYLPVLLNVLQDRLRELTLYLIFDKLEIRVGEGSCHIVAGQTEELPLSLLLKNGYREMILPSHLLSIPMRTSRLTVRAQNSAPDLSTVSCTALTIDYQGELDLRSSYNQAIKKSSSLHGLIRLDSLIDPEEALELRQILPQLQELSLLVLRRDQVWYLEQLLEYDPELCLELHCSFLSSTLDNLPGDCVVKFLQ